LSTGGRRLKNFDEGRAIGAFEKLVGLSLEDIEKYSDRATSKCRKCSGRSFHGERGYPGEHFVVCDSCGEIMGSSFHPSEIV
jgi:hypothetical protein